MKTEFNKSLGDKIVLFFKSQIAAYTDKNGRFVAAHYDKRTKKGEVKQATENLTADMFADAPSPEPKKADKKADWTDPDIFGEASKPGKKQADNDFPESFFPYKSGSELRSKATVTATSAYEAFDKLEGKDVKSDHPKSDDRLSKLEAQLKDLTAHEPRSGAAYSVKQKHYADTRKLREQIESLKASKPIKVDSVMAEDSPAPAKDADEYKPSERAIWIPNMKPAKLDKLLSKENLTDTDIESLKDFKYFLIHQKNDAAEKGFYQQLQTSGQKEAAYVLKNKFLLVNIDGKLRSVGSEGKVSVMAKSESSFDLFMKSHVKQFTRKDGSIVKEHDDKRQKKVQAAPVVRQPAQVEDQHGERRHEEPKDVEEVRGSAHGYGTHNMEEGDTIHFKAGEFSGSGKIKSVGKDGATVEDAEGRDHNVHWHEVTGFKADRGDGGGNKPPEDGNKPTAEGEDEPKKEPQKPTVLGKQEPIPAESFNAADYAKSHDQSDVSADSIIDQFPADTKEKISAAQDRLKSVEETISKFMTDGKWTVERQELHRKILYDGVMGKDDEGKPVKVPGLLSPERVSAARPGKGEQPAFIILGGRGGSGKSSFKGEVYEPDRCIVLDADHIKSMLPEYEGWNAHQVHEESGELFDHVADFARIMGLNVVLDKTMKTAKSAIADVEKFRRSGYRTEAHYMHLPRQEAGKRAVKRFLDGGESGRFVPPEIVLSNTTNEAAFDEVSKLVDAWSFRDNNVARGEKPILISQKGDPAMKKREILHKSMRKSIVIIWRKKK